MAAERTEKATPKKREDARKKGQIARGAELPATLAFLGALITIKIISTDLVSQAGYLIRETAVRITDLKPLTDTDLQIMLIESGKMLAVLVLPVVLAGLAAIVAGNFAQGGVSLSFQSLAPRSDKFSPAKNIKRIVGPDSIVNLGKSMLKLIFIMTVAYGVLGPLIENAPTFIHASLPTVAIKLGDTLYSLAFRCGLVLLVLALADYGYAWYKHEKSLRMTKQEIRDEYKQLEGDPTIKGQRRRTARSLMQRRSLADVHTATVVITNPTHFAVALRYDRERDAAPIVVAKGADVMAAKIRELARDHDIPLVENAPLARALYRIVEPRQTVPVEFFGAVAEILAYVFRLKER